jgi:hypothetical protein
VVFKRKDATMFDKTDLQAIPVAASRIINARSVDISKRTVGEAGVSVFGYPLNVNPTEYCGLMVEKSDQNYTHDGRVIQGPISPENVLRQCVYEIAIDNTCDKDGLVLDYRVPIYGDQIPLVYLKYRPKATRFSNKNAFVELHEPEAAFSPEELDSLQRFAVKMGIDYGELDVLRDHDRRIYVVDANNTPAGPPNGLPLSESKIALERLAKSFDRLLDKFTGSPCRRVGQPRKVQS